MGNRPSKKVTVHAKAWSAWQEWDAVAESASCVKGKRGSWGLELQPPLEASL